MTVLGLIAVIWCSLILICWMRWDATGKRLGASLVPTSMYSIITMPAWTVEAYYHAWRKRRDHQRVNRALLKQCRQLLASVPPDADPAVVKELSEMVEKLEAQSG